MLFWSPSNAYVRNDNPQLSVQSSIERPGNAKGERGEGIGGEGEEVALSGSRRRRPEGGRTAGVIEGNEMEALQRSQRSSGCGCQYPDDAPVSYTDTLQRYSMHTHTHLNTVIRALLQVIIL